MNRRIKTLVVALGLVALFSALTVSAVLAHDGGDGDGRWSGLTEEEREEKRARYEEARERFAAALGVTAEALDAASAQVALDRIDAAVEAGRISEERAEGLRAAVADGARLGWGLRGGGEALAEALGLTVEDLAAAKQQLALDRVDEALAAGAITEEKAAEWRAKIESGESGERSRTGRGFGKRGFGKHWSGYGTIAETAAAE